MKAIILAAGRGSRMKNLTSTMPKCLIKLHGKPLIEYQIESLRDAGIHKIAIVTGYKRELINDKADKEFHNNRWASTNMVSSLSCAREWLLDEPCVVSYSDIFYETKAVEDLMLDQSPLAITYDLNWLIHWKTRFENPLTDAETFKLDDNKNVIEIGQKPKTLEEIQGQYMGLLRFTPEAWTAVEKIRETLCPEENDKIHMTGLLQKIIDANTLKIQGIPFSGVWGEIDTQTDLNVYS